MFGFDLTSEQQELQQLARQFAREQIIPVAARHDETETFPATVCRQAWELGLMNLGVPKEYGGGGFGVLDTIFILEELNYGCAGITNALAANGLAVTPLLIAGNDAQKREYLGRLTRECAYAALCATEPGTGSEVAAMSTTYRAVGNEYVINGVKHFIANGTVASWYVLFATKETQRGRDGVSCFVVPADLPGIRTRRMQHKLGQRAADTAEVIFEDLTVPLQALVGDEQQGFQIARQTFDRTRPEIGAIYIGVSQRALDEATKYALERKQFGRPIVNFEAIQLMLDGMAIEIEAMRLLTYKAGWMIDQGAAASLASSYAQAFGAGAAARITTDAVQVFGGYGYMKDYPVEKLMRDAKLLQGYEGTPLLRPDRGAGPPR